MASGNHGPIVFTENIRRYPFFLVMLLLVCVVLFAGCGGGNETISAPSTPTAPPMASPTPKPTVGVTHVTITMTAQFDPTSIQVPVGTTVTWTNNDNVGHTVTFRNGMKDSGILLAGSSGVISNTGQFSNLLLAGGIGMLRYTFTSKGIFPYYDAINPSIHGVVIVT